MDYQTGIVGIKRRISYQSIRDMMFVQTRKGFEKERCEPPSKPKIQRAIKHLEKIGLIEQIKDKDHLVFRCILAKQDNSIQKIPDTKPIHYFDTKADIVKSSKNSNTMQSPRKSILKHDMIPNTPKSAIPDTPPLSGKDKEKELLRSSKKKAGRRMQIPDDFQVIEHHCDLAIKNGWPDPSTEIEQFRHYHKGKGSLMLNWDSAFYTWLGNAKRFKEKTNGNYQSNTKQPNSVTKVVDSILRRYEKPQH